MTLSRLIRKGGLREIVAERLAGLPADLSQFSRALTDECQRSSLPIVANVATVAVATSDGAIAEACRLAGVTLADLPERLCSELLAIQGADLPYLAALIRDHAEWHGWAGVIRLADYAPGGRFYKEH